MEIFYKYVKRKYCDGKIIFLCVPNHNKMHLEAAKNNYGININDIKAVVPKNGTIPNRLKKKSL